MNGKMSHTLRGCVDWNCNDYNNNSWSSKVTPCVGVWIETIKFSSISFIEKSHPAWVCGLKRAKLLKKQKRISHTLRGCVDWNVKPHNIIMQWIRHTLRGCVDWNATCREGIAMGFSHTLRGCVDWNQDTINALLMVNSHTLRGCVDWNYMIHGM